MNVVLENIKRVNPVFVIFLWISGAILSFSLMAVGGRELSGKISTFQILFIRSVIGFFIISIILCFWGWKKIYTKNIRLHFFRNFSHFIGQYGWFYGIAFIPLSDVFAIEFTTPIWTAILATLFLGESLRLNRKIAIAFGFIGVVIVLRPGIELIHPASLAVLAGAIGYAIAHTLTKKILQVDSPFSVIFYMAIIQMPLGLIPSLNNWITPAGLMWIWLTLVGITALSAHYCIAKAFAHADATVVVPLDFLRLPIIAVVGFILYDEKIDWYVLIGASLMLLGNVTSLYFEKKNITS